MISAQSRWCLIEPLSAVLLLVLVNHDADDDTHDDAEHHLKQGGDQAGRSYSTNSPMKNFLMPLMPGTSGSSW